jgi:TonB family protein
MVLPYGIAVFVFLAGYLGATEAAKWPCDATAGVLKDRDGRTVWFDSTELERLAIHKSTPRMPSSARVEGTVTVEVVVDKAGKVGCARVAAGHPLLRKSALEAVEHWTFKPYVSEGEPIAIMGRLTLRFSTSRPDP